MSAAGTTAAAAAAGADPAGSIGTPDAGPTADSAGPLFARSNLGGILDRLNRVTVYLDTSRSSTTKIRFDSLARGVYRSWYPNTVDDGIGR